MFTYQQQSNIWTAPPPLPEDPSDQERWRHTALRRRILGGIWGEDLEQWLRAHLGTIRRQVTGPRDLSSNVLRTIAVQLSVLYDRGRLVRHAAGPYPALLASGRRELQEQGIEPGGTPPGILARAGLWQMMQRVQRNVIGCNEYLMHVSWSRRGKLLYRQVAPDHVIAYALPECPDEPVIIKEARQWKHPATKRTVWVWECYDISDLDRPAYYVETCHAGRMGRRERFKEMLGSAYPWRFRTRDAEPFIPITMYHRERTGELWDPYEGREVVDGTLTVAMLWSFFVHGVRDASWTQRYIVNGLPAGTAAASEEEDGAPVNTLPSDPASIMVFESPEDLPQGATVQVGQWSAPFAPDLIGQAIARFEERLAQYVGVSPSDLSRTTGDPRSGYALAVSDVGLQRAQAKFSPQFDRGDADLIAKSAAILNLNSGSMLPMFPEDGYQPYSPPRIQVQPGKEPDPDPKPEPQE
ncbi:MAG: hypothetical protein AAFV53_32460 [Myxococcota bacterium]